MAESSKLPMLLLCACASLLTACGRDTPSSAAGTATMSLYKPTGTFQEIMGSIIDPSADFLWESVATVSDAAGIHQTQPRTNEEWNEVRRRALLLAEAANLIVVPGRHVADGDKTAEGGEPLAVAEIQQRLDTRHEELAGFASALREISVKLIDAADAKDAAAIFELGGTLDEVCESCHKVFWYPEQE